MKTKKTDLVSTKDTRVEDRPSRDIMSPEKRSALMSRIRYKDTGPEKTIMGALRAKGIEFENHARDLPGCPDVVFRSFKIAVFINGDFWHGWRFPQWEQRLSGKWRRKISNTRQRDKRNYNKLRRMGWKVIRIWEHQVKKNLEVCIKKIADVLPEKDYPAIYSEKGKITELTNTQK